MAGSRDTVDPNFRSEPLLGLGGPLQTDHPRPGTAYPGEWQQAPATEGKEFKIHIINIFEHSN